MAMFRLAPFFPSRVVAPFVPSKASGTVQDLAGTAAAAASAAAELAITKAMAGAATGGASSTAALTLLKSLLVAAQGQAAAVGDLGLAKLLAGAATGGALATGDLSATGAAGTITSLPIGVADSVTNFVNETGVTVRVYTEAGVHVVTLTGETTDASAICTFSHALIVPGTTYAIWGTLASGADFFARKAAT